MHLKHNIQNMKKIWKDKAIIICMKKTFKWSCSHLNVFFWQTFSVLPHNLLFHFRWGYYESANIRLTFAMKDTKKEFIFLFSSFLLSSLSNFSMENFSSALTRVNGMLMNASEFNTCCCCCFVTVLDVVVVVAYIFVNENKLVNVTGEGAVVVAEMIVSTQYRWPLLSTDF